MSTMKTDGPDKQMEFLAKQAAQPSPCPKCGVSLNMYDACVEEKLDLGDWSAKNTFTCKGCSTPLRYTLPWPTGAWHWRLAAQCNCDTCGKLVECASLVVDTEEASYCPECWAKPENRAGVTLK